MEIRIIDGQNEHYYDNLDEVFELNELDKNKMKEVEDCVDLQLMLSEKLNRTIKVRLLESVVVKFTDFDNSVSTVAFNTPQEAKKFTSDLAKETKKLFSQYKFSIAEYLTEHLIARSAFIYEYDIQGNMVNKLGGFTTEIKLLNISWKEEETADTLITTMMIS